MRKECVGDAGEADYTDRQADLEMSDFDWSNINHLLGSARSLLESGKLFKAIFVLISFGSLEFVFFLNRFGLALQLLDVSGALHHGFVISLYFAMSWGLAMVAQKMAEALTVDSKFHGFVSYQPFQNFEWLPRVPILQLVGFAGAFSTLYGGTLLLTHLALYSLVLLILFRWFKRASAVVLPLVLIFFAISMGGSRAEMALYSNQICVEGVEEPIVTFASTSHGLVVWFPERKTSGIVPWNAGLLIELSQWPLSVRPGMFETHRVLFGQKPDWGSCSIAHGAGDRTSRASEIRGKSQDHSKPLR